MNKENKKEFISYIIIIIIVILIRTFIVTPVRVNGSSMYSTLKNGNIMFLNKITYKFNDIKRFDIVVIKYNKEKLIKRVIAFPGETVKFKNNVLYINDKAIEEDFLKEKTSNYEYDGVIPKDCYFVMGDNRDNSLDSRYFGCFMKKSILGKANFVIFPFSDFGKKE